ncbi:MAG: class I tRNA ligase family protein, partial [Candidatus Omnitrophica bacterium]|nr:class I tRNA ligase family protein [Candidatus Omnitrophota bacterium]
VALKSKKNNQIWIVADKLVDKFLNETNLKKGDFTIIWALKGKELEGSLYQHPFNIRQGKIVLADYVSMEEGTGCVHTACGHGLEDYFTGKKYNLDIIMPVDDKGRFDLSVGEFSGLFVYDANEKIIKKLKEVESLILEGTIKHMYPHCWRCKNPIIFRATYQWFLNIDHKNLRQKLLEEIEKVLWVPSSGKERIKAMLLQRPDWCLSRQRLWGVPIPAIRCRDCNEVILEKEVISKTAEIFRVKGSSAWFNLPIENFLPQDFSCKKCLSKNFDKENDILDVWFESGASFFAVLKDNDELSFPADMYLEGSDQHRGWFQVSLILSVAKENIAPFRKILTHGFVVDGEGRKMSKSLGNVISPQDIIKKYGAEILRLWVAYSDYSEDIKISQEIINQLVDIYRKIRNTIRFILGNIYDFDLESKNLKYEELCEVDKYMFSKTIRFYKEIIYAYENFQFYKVCQGIFNFCNLELSSFYLDILKDRLYTFSPNSAERRSAQFVLFTILITLLKLIAPILSFTAEEAYSSLKNYKNKKESIFLETFEDFPVEYENSALLEKWEKILKLRQAVLLEIEKLREKKVIGSSLEAKVILEFDDEYEFFRGLDDILREIFIVSSVSIQSGDSKIIVERIKGEKCLRCWNYRDDVGKDKDYPFICNRCINALKGGKI